MATLTSAERRELAIGGKTLAQIAANRPVKTASPTAPAKTVEPAAAAPAAEPAAPAAADPAAPAEPAAAAPAADPAAPAGDPEDAKSPDRFRFKDPEDQAIALLAKTKGISLSAASKLYHGDTAAAPAAPVAPAEDSDLKNYDTEIAAKEAAIAQFAKDRKQAREDVDNDKADSLSDQIAAATSELGLLKNARAGHVRNREAVTQRTVVDQVTASRDRLFADYTELATEGSLHRLALDTFVNKALADPKRAKLFDDPAWPEKLGDEFATAHGLKKKSAAAPAALAAPAPGTPAAPTAKPAPTPSLRPAVRQVTSAPGAKLVTTSDAGNPSPAATPLSPAEMRAAISRMPPEQRRRLALKSLG